MSVGPSVGVVVVNYNSAAFIGPFLAALRETAYENLHLIVVDSASQDRSLDEIQRAWPEAALLRQPENVGTARGNNIGARYAVEQGYDFLLFLNNDTTFEPDFLRRLVDAADARTMTVPRILFSEDRRLISTHAGDFDWSLGLFRNTYHGKPDGPATRRQRVLQTASFCCLLMPAKAFLDAGPLDERFFMYYEETDLLRRAGEAGYRLLYVPDAVVYHLESASSGGGWMTPMKLYYATRNRLYLVHKHARVRWRFAMFTAYFWMTRLIMLLRFAVTGRRRMLKPTVLGVVDYYRGRMGRTLEASDFAR